ncbi:GAF domain-containing protein [Lyngbya aestuarii]|uniref:GAF domain-containing protein n=1 Tax=Lyngbya aestuarii TaxID=118322 RepID=UPI00403E2D39
MANKFESKAISENYNLNGQEKNFLDSLQLNNFLRNSNTRLPISYQPKSQPTSKLAKPQRFQEGVIFRWLRQALEQKAQALVIACCIVPMLLIGGTIYYQTNQSLTPKIFQIPITHTTTQTQKVKDLVTYPPLKKQENQPELDWEDVVATPVAIAFRAKRDIMLTLLLGTGGIALLGVVMGAVVASRLQEQAEELTTVESKLGYTNDQVGILLEERKRYLEQLQLLADVATVASKTEDRTYIFDQAVRGAKQWLGVERVIIYGFESSSQGSVIAEAVAPGWPQTLTKQITDSCIPGKILEDYRKGKVTTIHDISATSYCPEHLQLLKQLEVKSSLVVPIILNNNLLGLLIAHQCTKARFWQQSEINFLQFLAIQVGLSLTSLALAAQSKAEAVRYFQLDAITAHFRQSLDLEDIYNIATNRVRETLKTDRVFVYLFDENWQGKIIAEAVGQEWSKMFELNIADPCLSKYVEEYKRGRVVAVENIHQAGLSDCYLEQLAPFQVKAYLVAPLLTCGNLHALLVTHQCSHKRAWQESEITFFKQVAVLVSYALDQAAFLEERERACLVTESVSQEGIKQTKETARSSTSSQQISSFLKQTAEVAQELQAPVSAFPITPEN